MPEVAYQQTLVTETCCVCFIEFGIPKDFQNRRRNDHERFFCPSGHGQSYNGTSEAERLRIELAEKERALVQERNRVSFERNGRIAAERDRTKVKNKLTRLTHRVNCGVCPHCQRTFKQLAAHMKTQHPGAK